MRQKGRQVQTLGPSLFDIIEEQEVKEKPEECRHTNRKDTVTVWAGETWERLTETCVLCGWVIGRYPK